MGLLRILLLFGLGGLTGWCHAPLDLWVVSLFTFPAFLHLLRPFHGWRAYAASWVFAFGYFLFGLYWIAAALLLDIRQFWWAVPFAVAGLPFVLATFQAVAGAAAQLWGRSRPEETLSRLFVFALVWSVMEWVRGHVFTGFPWLLVGQMWVEVESARLLAALGGAYLLSLWAVTLAVLPAAPRSRRGLAAVVGLALLAGAVGHAQWGARERGPGDPDSLTVRILQPNIAQDLKLDQNARDRMLDQTLRAAVTAPLTGASPLRPPDVVIWPETAVPYRMEDDPDLRKMVAETLPLGTALLLTGVVRRDADQRYYNSLMVLDRDGTILATYDKAHLVPFGEYIPFQRFLPVDPIAGGAAFSPGPGPRTVRVGARPPFSPLICYEAIFPGAVTDPRDRPRWLVNITNDGWYGLTHGPYQHLALARLRAVEEGLPLVRAANTGISAVISARGEVLAALALGHAGRLEATFPLTSFATLYHRWKDTVWAVIVASGLLLAFVVRRFSRIVHPVGANSRHLI